MLKLMLESSSSFLSSFVSEYPVIGAQVAGLLLGALLLALACRVRRSYQARQKAQRRRALMQSVRRYESSRQVVI